MDTQNKKVKPMGFLTLGRKTGESVFISHPDGDVEVMVSSSQGHNHRLSIRAPQSVKINRSEIYNN